ncbi:MAG: hypothetical protein M1828_001727 [Chrysothrix sp. TS-e1954]|nr:MAG: hypothetical protein M1828_001727 [Chrysothrix sp. TS-e1954]
MAFNAANAFASHPLQQSPQSVTFSQQEADYHNGQDDGQGWSGDESGQELDESGSRKRKRPMNRLEGVISHQQDAINHLTANSPMSTHQTQQDHPQMLNEAPQMPTHHQHNSIGDSSPLHSRTASFPTPQTANMADYKSGFGPYNGYQRPPESPYHEKASPMAIQTPQSLYNPTPQTVKTSELVTPSASAALPQDLDVPPYDLLYSLADLYFKNINTWCPILHRRTTMDALFGTSSLDEADRAVLHAIVATTLRYSNDPRLTPETRTRFHASSKQKVILFGLENSSVKALQALVILALDLCGDSNGPPGWNLLAVITRSAVQLGLSIEATSQLISPRYQSIYTLRAMVLPESSSWIEEESRRRLFWMIYVLDRYSTITTAFDFALDEKEIDRKLPCRDDLFSRNQPVETRWFNRHEKPDRGCDRPEHLGSFSYYIEIVGILSRIHQFLKRPVDIGNLPDVERWQEEYKDLDAVLNAWKSSLPKEYGNMTRLFDASSGNKIVNCGWVMLHATFHTTTIRLHSSAAYPTNRSQLFAPSYTASQRCMSAVEQISSLCHHVRSVGMLNKLGPPFAFSVWVASRLLLVHSSTIDHQMNSNISHFLTTLKELGQYWKVADRYANLLQRVLDEYSESASGPKGGRVTPSSVRILADMRRCAYDLDFLISRQPRQQTLVGTNSNTPSRTPAPNELEYLDVFDFFNMPRLPTQLDGTMGNGVSTVAGHNYNLQDANNPANEFNATSFMYDANADWMKC